MSSAAVEPLLPPADEAVLRAHADELRALAARFGMSDLRFASAGKLVGHVTEHRDALDVADFEVAAVELLGAELRLYSDRVLGNRNVSRDLVAARPP